MARKFRIKRENDDTALQVAMERQRALGYDEGYKTRQAEEVAEQRTYDKGFGDGRRAGYKDGFAAGLAPVEPEDGGDKYAYWPPRAKWKKYRRERNDGTYMGWLSSHPCKVYQVSEHNPLWVVSSPKTGTHTGVSLYEALDKAIDYTTVRRRVDLVE